MLLLFFLTNLCWARWWCWWWLQCWGEVEVTSSWLEPAAIPSNSSTHRAFTPPRTSAQASSAQLDVTYESSPLWRKQIQHVFNVWLAFGKIGERKHHAHRRRPKRRPDVSRMLSWNHFFCAIFSFIGVNQCNARGPHVIGMQIHSSFMLGGKARELMNRASFGASASSSTTERACKMLCNNFEVVTAGNAKDGSRRAEFQKFSSCRNSVKTKLTRKRRNNTKPPETIVMSQSESLSPWREAQNS